MHSLLTELEQGEYSSSNLRSMYAIKRRLTHLYRVARVQIPAVAAVADAPNDPAAFRRLVPGHSKRFKWAPGNLE